MKLTRRRRRSFTRKQWLKNRNRILLKAVKIVDPRRKKRYTKKRWLISNIYEAYCTYENLLEYIIEDPKWKPDLMQANFMEIYWHTNLAWNSRNASLRKIKAAIKDNRIFYGWLKYPKDIVFERPKQEKGRLAA